MDGPHGPKGSLVSGWQREPAPFPSGPYPMMGIENPSPALQVPTQSCWLPF